MTAGAGGSGATGGMTTGGSPAAICAASSAPHNAGLTPLRRLTRLEYNNTVRDLLGATGTPAQELGADEQIGPFYSNAIAPIDELQVEKTATIAATLATAAKARMSQLSPCDLAQDTGTSCATRFVTEFGQRAFRRPLSDAEKTKYVGVYTVGRQGADGAANGFKLVVEAMLQSPYFLYHHDVGSTGAIQPGTVALSPWELASRLSYFLWSSMPDDTLFSLAANGTLNEENTITAQVDRLLKDARAGTTIAMFHQQWLDVDEVGAREKGEAFSSHDSERDKL